MGRREVGQDLRGPRSATPPHALQYRVVPVLIIPLDPATDKLIGTSAECDLEDTHAAIAAAEAALPAFRKKTGRERSKILRKWYDLMMENVDDLAALITWENGKPLADARGEVNYAANFFEWFSEEAPRAYGDTIPASVAGNRVFTTKEPVGVCGLITP